MIAIVKQLFGRKSTGAEEKEPGAGYDLWADNYDRQPGNLMLDFDEEIFSLLLQKVELKGKVVADIGCGTGRHWKKVLDHYPAVLHGFDVSKEMLRHLKEKFPSAAISQIKDNHFSDVNDATFDVIISTLTVAHIRNIKEAISAWCRILGPGGQLIITDFHPIALAAGASRTFKKDQQLITIRNYIHSIETIKSILHDFGVHVMYEEERIINEQVKRYYQQADAMNVYNQFKSVPMIYGLYLKKTDGTE